MFFSGWYKADKIKWANDCWNIGNKWREKGGGGIVQAKKPGQNIHTPHMFFFFMDDAQKYLKIIIECFYIQLSLCNVHIV